MLFSAIGERIVTSVDRARAIQVRQGSALRVTDDASVEGTTYEFCVSVDDDEGKWKQCGDVPSDGAGGGGYPQNCKATIHVSGTPFDGSSPSPMLLQLRAVCKGLSSTVFQVVVSVKGTTACGSLVWA